MRSYGIWVEMETAAEADQRLCPLPRPGSAKKGQLVRNAALGFTPSPLTPEGRRKKPDPSCSRALYSPQRAATRAPSFHAPIRRGRAADVISALRPYQNADGGFGNALEPDLRGDASQPVPFEHAFQILDEADDFDTEIVRQG